MTTRTRFIDPKSFAAAFRYDKISGQITRRVATKRSPAGQVVPQSQNFGSYLYIAHDGATYPAQRIAWVLATGEQPLIVDHRNGVKHDNRWSNLRNGTSAQNNANKRIHRIAEGRDGPHE